MPDGDVNLALCRRLGISTDVLAVAGDILFPTLPSRVWKWPLRQHHQPSMAQDVTERLARLTIEDYSPSSGIDTLHTPLRPVVQPEADMGRSGPGQDDPGGSAYPQLPRLPPRRRTTALVEAVPSGKQSLPIPGTRALLPAATAYPPDLDCTIATKAAARDSLVQLEPHRLHSAGSLPSRPQPRIASSRPRAISGTYKFYKAREAGWQNSIRHKLSIHKAFIKMERPKNDPGKGNYWTIQEGMAMQFIKEKPARMSNAAASIPIISSCLGPSRPIPEPTLPPPLPIPLPTSQPTRPAEPSSDATIPGPDPLTPEVVASGAYLKLPNCLPLAMVMKSPTVPRHVPIRPLLGFSPPSFNCKLKRKLPCMNDTGLISADRLRSKRNRPDHRGRAEMEIARLRAEDRGRSTVRSHNVFGLTSWSPFRETGQMHLPLTAMMLKPLDKPSPPGSLNTNLRMLRNQVREILQIPLRNMTDEDPAPYCADSNFNAAFYDTSDDPPMFGDFLMWNDLDVYGSPWEH
ncbi:fork head domain-containing protein [Microdochium trichocladiopsis]|uniref:Fork head domain-containing protein n=1 Tax=Microdochium trichocladiopsis TaxID=1682393 RepID=A0A9P9BKA5_9PEZI|nr:fork head domain-containing protein [Microdochium trichocladiopsis]KAH7009223.1 fork head domain-containing protein [Microdochium trichocladiopsis]